MTLVYTIVYIHLYHTLAMNFFQVAPNVTVDEQLEGFLGPVGFVCVIDPAVKH